MKQHTPEVAELLILVAKKYAKNLKTTTDFEEFSLELIRHNISLSTATIKRLWGYVNDKHNPRTDTLDALSQYLGFPLFSAFCNHLKTGTNYNSSFFSTEKILIEDLQPKEKVEIGWSPNRRLLLVYEGEHLFTALEAENSKIQAGDKFETVSFMKGQPLYLPYVLRNGEKLPAFIAGRTSGLTVINKITDAKQ